VPELDAATLEILIDVKQRGEAAFAEASALAINLREAIDSMNRRTAEGVPVIEAARRAIGELSRGLIESELPLKVQTEQIKDLRQALARYIEVVNAGMAPESAYTAVVAANTSAMGANAAATTAASTAGAGGIPTWLAVTGVVVGLTLALWPFVTLVGSAAIAMTSFAVAGAGFLLTAGLVAGVFAAIGGAVLLLGGGTSGAAGAAAALQTATDKLTNAQEALVEFDQEHTKQLTILQQHQREQLVENIANAQQKYNDALTASQGPMAVLLGQLGAMRDAWAQQAAPMAAAITQWAAQGIPAVQQLGSTIMDWFGARLPAVLQGISKVIKDLAPDFNAFGQYFGGVMDHIGPLIAPIAEGFARLALQGARGLLDNLVKLSDWFVKELPTLGPIMQQIFGKIGDAIQWVAGQWGTLTDFAQNKWPTTVKNAQDSLRALQGWWQQNGDTIKTFTQNVIDLMGAFNQIIIRWQQVYNFLNGVGLTPTPLISAINDVASALQWAANEAERLERANPFGSSGQGGPAGRQTTFNRPPIRQRGFVS
jgi:hypothetical protein